MGGSCRAGAGPSVAGRTTGHYWAHTQHMLWDRHWPLKGVHS